MIVIGLSSGTSVDGVDVAAADLSLDGDSVVLSTRGHLEFPYPPGVREQIVSALPPGPTSMEAVCQIDTAVGQAFADAARRGVETLAGGNADLVVSHGQTLFHWVDGTRARGTLQLGQPAWIAEATGLPVVSDLRSRDVAAGGHGAPLASTLDVLLLAGRSGTSAALNIGGIANLTVVSGDRAPVAFDTGPGNALIDAAVHWLTSGEQTYDRDGLRAARGQVDEKLLDVLLREPYYSWPPPKSTGRELFHAAHLRSACTEAGVDLDSADAPDGVVATVTALTARTVADACVRHAVTEVVASGGGTDNPTLMAMLADALGDAVALRTVEDLGLPRAAKEAYLFALLGFLTYHGVPATVPGCTGARHPSLLGSLTPGAGPLAPPTPRSTPPTRLRLI